MQWRILEVNSDDKYLCKYRGFVILKYGNDELARVPIEDINSVVISSNNATLSKQLMISLAEQAVPIILCGKDYLPKSITLPYGNHHKFKQLIDTQITASIPLKKRLWQAIIKAKIHNQVQLLIHQQKREGANRLKALMSKVKSGDSSNVEAQAAKHYWKHFSNERFYRRPQAKDELNSLLNYSYIVVRSCCARAIVSAGLLPALGVGHKNIYNPFCLVDDIIEPFRPCADQLVLKVIDSGHTKLDSENKSELAKVLSKTMYYKGKRTIVSEAIQKLAFSLARSYREKENCLEFCDLFNG